jgi:protein TonB
MVNSIEIAAIIAIVLAVRLSQHAPPVVLPDPDVPIIHIPYTQIQQPPSLDLPQIDLPKVEPNAAPITSAVPLPVPDPQALDPTMPTQNQLGFINNPPVVPGSDSGRVRVVIDSQPIVSQPGPENPDIPDPKKFIYTIRRPELVSVPSPVYPERCRALGLEGKAVIQMLVDLDGSVLQARVMQSAGNSDLDSAAVKAAQGGRFSPALGGGSRPVRVWVAVPFVFELQR